MRGYPKSINAINSRQDVSNLLAIYPERMKADLQLLLGEVKTWQQGTQLADGDPGLTDTTHQVRSITEEDGEARYQYELLEDPHCKLYRLGLSSAEAEEMIHA